jgi:hypothetical protein
MPGSPCPPELEDARMTSEHHAHHGPGYASPAAAMQAPRFYPDLRGWMLKLDAGDDGLRVDPGFFVDFHPGRSHEIHLPGGDPTTEIFS